MTGASAFDSDACELTTGYKAAVASTIPKNSVCPTPAFWRELTMVLEGYVAMTERRVRHPPKDELARGRKIVALADELGKELREVRRDHPLWSDISRRALAALWPVKEYAASHAALYEILAGSPFRGRKDAHREFLYDAVLDLWRNELGQELRYSRDGDGTPTGPLIRFFTAVVAPVLGTKSPKVSGIADIVDRAKARRGHAGSNSRR